MKDAANVATVVPLQPRAKWVKYMPSHKMALIDVSGVDSDLVGPLGLNQAEHDLIKRKYQQHLFKKDDIVSSKVPRVPKLYLHKREQSPYL